MCGIVGFFSRSGQPAIDADRLKYMRDTMTHRGPDDAGLKMFDEGRAGFAHRRLSIIDLSSAAHEPMQYLGGRYWLTYNGEVYNFLELRSQLEGKGYSFCSASDAEVILAAYAEWGPECVNHFNGMWAFAIWDNEEKELFCSRDRFGIKPFYFYDDGDMFIFASETRAILASGHIDVKPCEKSMATYLKTGVVDGLDETFFDGIFRLKPAHWLVLSEKETKLKQYWQINVSPRDSKISQQDFGEIREIFEDTVRLRLISDVPLGVCLSGGLDSSSIFAVASRVSGRQLKTFSSFFTEDETYDERPFFNIIANKYRADKYTVQPDGSNLMQILPKIIWHLEEPPFAPGVFPQWHVMEMASPLVHVLLDGQGGDELLAGYMHYYRYLLLDMFGSSNLAGYWRERKEALKCGISIPRTGAIIEYIIPGEIGNIWNKIRSMPGPIPRKIRHEWSRVRSVLNTCLRRSRGNGNISEQELSVYNKWDIANGERLSRVMPEIPQINWPYFGDSRSWLNERLYQDITYAMLPALLKYEDKIGMAFSIEARVPFLDYRLVEKVFSLPPFAKIFNGWTKYVFRRAMNGILPREIQWRRDKKGFPTPFKEWFKSSLFPHVESYILEAKLVSDGYLDKKKIEHFLQGHCNGVYDLSRHIWLWLSLSFWYEIHNKLADRSLGAEPVKRILRIRET